jgi:hypothetical protein
MLNEASNVGSASAAATPVVPASPAAVASAAAASASVGNAVSSTLCSPTGNKGGARSAQSPASAKFPQLRLLLAEDNKINQKVAVR